MKRSLALALLVSGVLLSPFPTQAETPEKLSFNRDIRPILSDKCFACHGFDAKHREAELRLDTPEGATAKHDDIQAIVPGEPTQSELWKRISSANPDEQMPPANSQKKLSDAEKQTLKRWIEEGAVYQKHWAFEPIKAPTVPTVTAPNVRVQNPIDAFIGERLAHENLTMAPEADKNTLIRRVAFALTGLPPTPAEVAAYVTDTSPLAYEKMVDSYLASPRYGEEMGRHWLDVARYGDTHGLHLDNERQMWAYRDWVIQSFNNNQPFDQFTVEQIAGDMLPNATPDQLVATGFNRCNITTSEGGSINDELLFRYAVDRASTTAETWLGLTYGCAVCHDHKFDPISHKEFYSLYAFFNSAADPGFDGNALLTAPVQKLESPEILAKMQVLDDQLAAKQAEMEEQATRIQYTDPATVTPPPAPTDAEIVWMEDDFPTGAQVQSTAGPKVTFVDAQGGKVFSGQRSLKRTDKALGQDYYNAGAAPLTVPESARVFVYAYLDPADPPQSIMIQFHTNGWKHRAVWGDYNLIPFGAVNTTERFNAGELPELGKWVRLEVPVDKMGLKEGDQIIGFACTQFAGTVYWDKLGVSGHSDPANDPQHSFQVWWKQSQGKDVAGIPPDLNPIAKKGPAADVKPADQARLQAYYLRTVSVDFKPQFEAVQRDIAKLQTERDAIAKSAPSTFIFRDLPQPRDSFVMLRGAYDKKGEKVLPGTMAVLPPLAQAHPERANRLDLAKWLVAPEHPLTARVTVNRFWQQFYGTGLVKTSFDFGSQGEMPSHPELLDWLSTNFRTEGWNVKALVRLMLTSATFRQESKLTPALYAKDPANRLYARGPRFRLDAEQIRDNSLFVSGLMNLEMGGKGVKTYQPPNIWEPVGFTGSNTANYKRDDGPALYRRSVYVFLKRTAPPPFMSNFDAPSREQFCTIRERSNTPLQALQLMNDVQHVEAARALAQRMLTAGGKTAPERIQFVYRTVLARDAQADELAIVEEELNKHLARYTPDIEAAKKLIAQGESKPLAELAPAELAAYTLVANMILNLDETVNRN